MKPQYYYCCCFLHSNIFLRDLKMHIQYTCKDRFKRDYKSVLQNKSPDEINSIIDEVEEEIALRRNRFVDKLERKKMVVSSYTRLHPELWNLQEHYLHPHFLELVEAARKRCNLGDLTNFTVVSKEKRLYGFPVFTEEFVDRLNEELDNFEASPLEKGRPNTMNRYGISLDELGFDEGFLDRLRTQYLEPLSTLCYPEWIRDSNHGPSGLDSHRTFTVQYRTGEDEELHEHFDNAEVTVNVALSDEHKEGELFFGDMSNVPLDLSTCLKLEPLPKGYGLLHRGQHIHGALPIASGLRRNLIMWMRSSGVRNERCPMCGLSPELEPAPLGTTGDGFTVPSQEGPRCNLT